MLSGEVKILAASATNTFRTLWKASMRQLIEGLLTWFSASWVIDWGCYELNVVQTYYESKSNTEARENEQNPEGYTGVNTKGIKNVIASSSFVQPNNTIKLSAPIRVSPAHNSANSTHHMNRITTCHSLRQAVVKLFIIRELITYDRMWPPLKFMIQMSHLCWSWDIPKRNWHDSWNDTVFFWGNNFIIVWIDFFLENSRALLNHNYSCLFAYLCVDFVVRPTQSQIKFWLIEQVFLFSTFLSQEIDENKKYYFSKFRILPCIFSFRNDWGKSFV
jgi:hypothetical protein